MEPTQTAPSEATKACPFCAEPVRLHAKKCRHCGEFIGKSPLLRKMSTRLVAMLGLATATLSLFYALREGYFYIETRQQARAEIDTYQHVADQFRQMQSYHYAQMALQKALALSPSDIRLQRGLFVLEAEMLLDEVEWRPATEAQLDEVEGLILTGYRLAGVETERGHKVTLLLALARLLPQDRSWNDPQSVRDLYQQALELAPADAEVVFRYGDWLIESEQDEAQGLAMLQQASEMEPERALYHYRLGVLLLKNQQWLAAYQHVQAAISVRDSQTLLADIRSSNMAKTQLYRWLMDVSSRFDLLDESFPLTTMQQRLSLLEQLLTYQPNDRRLNELAARFYLHIQAADAAQTALFKVLSERDRSRGVISYNLDAYEMYARLLRLQGDQPDTLAEVEQKLAEFKNQQQFQDVMEWGLVGEHRYKIGLRLDKARLPQLFVVKAFSGYPFAIAGVQEGDRIDTLAHREVQDLRHMLNIINAFEADTRVPLKVLRDNEVLDLTLVIE